MIDTAAIVWALIACTGVLAFVISAGFRDIRKGLDSISEWLSVISNKDLPQ